MQQQPTRSSEEPTPDPEQGVKQKTSCSEAPPQGYAPPPQGYAPPPQGYATPPQGYAPPPQGYTPPPQRYAPPPPTYGYPPPMPMMHGEPMNYSKTEEERTGCMACLVWPLAIAACFCCGLALIGCIPFFFAYLSEQYAMRPAEERKRYRIMSIGCSSCMIAAVIIILIVVIIVFSGSVSYTLKVADRSSDNFNRARDDMNKERENFWRNVPNIPTRFNAPTFFGGRRFLNQDANGTTPTTTLT